MKGKKFQDYDSMVAKGILLHREIDFYTDTHPIVLQSKDRLREKYRHYSGVIVDMFYDHFLAKNFASYSDISLGDFVESGYAVMEENSKMMPERAQKMLPYMVRGNWLVSYAEPEGIHRALQGLSRRTKFESKLEFAIQDLLKFYPEFETEFTAFFKEIQAHISQFREDLINSPQ